MTMLDIKKSGQTSPSLVSKALKVTGQLESSEDIQIDGTIEGDVRGLSINVGSEAMVKGTIHGESVELSGTVEGKIEARRVLLTATSRMSGDVIHEELRVESGAYLNGHCRPDFGKSNVNKIQPLHAPTSVAEKDGPNKEAKGGAKA